jgi:hypothetical protein
MDPFDTNIITSAPQTVKIVDDHEVSMAAAQVYRAAKCAMEIHRMLKMVDNLEGWMQAKITLAADYLEAVSSNLEYDLVAATMMESQTLNENPDHKHARIAALGREIMDLAQGMTGKSDADFDLMNRLSAVGEKMTMIGTPFGPKGLTSEEKDLVRQAQDMLKKKEHKQLDEALPEVVGRMLGIDPVSREMKQVNPQGRLVNILMNWGMGRDAAGEIAVQYIKNNMLSQPRPAQIKKWTDMLVAKGRNAAEAARMAQELVKESMVHESQHRRHLPGVSGKIIAHADEYVLVHDVDKQDDVKKNEYEVYTKDGERVTNLDMPYSTPSAAEKRFKKEYGSR